MEETTPELGGFGWRKPQGGRHSMVDSSTAGVGGFGDVLVGPFDCRSRWATCGLPTPVNSRLGEAGLAGGLDHS